VLAHLANKAPLLASTIIVALLNINFAVAVFVQVVRAYKLFAMHCIVRDFWLDGQPELLRRLKANSSSRKVLETTRFSVCVSVAVVLGQFLPILFVSLAAPFK
jgi:hypothetical protein